MASKSKAKTKSKTPFKKNEINKVFAKIEHNFTDEDEADFRVRGEEVIKILKEEIPKKEWEGMEGPDQYPELADLDKVAKYRLQQIRLLGSIKMYDKVMECWNECFSTLSMCHEDEFHKIYFDPLLTVQYFELYKWREDFFHKHFPIGTWKLDDKYATIDDVVPYNIMGSHFNRLVAIACGDRKPATKDGDYLDIQSAPEESPNIQLMFSKEHFKKMIEVDKEIYSNMNTDHVLHMLAAVYPKNPFSLQYQASKIFWANDIPLNDLPKPIRKVVKQLLSPKYISKKNIKDILSDEGKKIFMEGVAKFYWRRRVYCPR